MNSKEPEFKNIDESKYAIYFDSVAKLYFVTKKENVERIQKTIDKAKGVENVDEKEVIEGYYLKDEGNNKHTFWGEKDYLNEEIKIKNLD